MYGLSRRIAALLIAGLLAAGPLGRPAQAQETYGLDGPLPGANSCGAGDAGEAHFTIAATGDTFPHENIQAAGEANGYDWLFDRVRPYLRAADLAYTNFDGAMLAGSPYTGYPAFNYNPALAGALRRAGIGLVSTANNHILDRGPEGLDATLGVLAEAGIQQHGAVASTAAERPAYLPITLERDGAQITIGVVSATWGTNGLPDPHGQVNLLYESSEYGRQGGVRQGVLDAVAQARRETDLVLVAAHWGVEYQFYPQASQVEAARQLADAGADIILGAQSHTLQPVDLIRSGERSTLVIYSLANFLASQGAFQAQSYSATSVIFYVGIARAPGGPARVTGYRYLPTIHVDGDTRPAPIAPGELPEVIAHVRAIMRDAQGLRQVRPESAPRALVCPPLALPEAPGAPIPGDFAQHYASLGDAAIAVLGLPLGPVRREPAGDCATPTAVLYTERQRLELHPAQEWPHRVVGSRIGEPALRRRHPQARVERREDLSAADAFAAPPFRVFFEQRGGLPIFGYPISGALSEEDAISKAMTTVQYFERARFELAPDGQVRLGLLGRELGGLESLCPGGPRPAQGQASPTSPAEAPGSAAPTPQPAPPRPTVAQSAAPAPGVAIFGAVAQIGGDIGSWLLPLVVGALVLVILVLAGFAVADWRAFQQRGSRRSYRRRRTAHDRFASEPAQPLPPEPEYVPAAPPPADGPAVRRTYGVAPEDLALGDAWEAPAPPPQPGRAASRAASEDDLLRQLLGDG